MMSCSLSYQASFSLKRLVQGYPKLADHSLSTKMQSLDQTFETRLSAPHQAAYLAPDDKSLFWLQIILDMRRLFIWGASV